MPFPPGGEGADQRPAIEPARRAGRRLLLVPRIDGKFGAIGPAARLGESAELPTGAEAFMIRGEYRARLGSGQADIGGALWVKADPILDPEPPTEKALELAREYRALLENLVESRGVPQVVQFLRAARTPGHLADLAGYSPDLSTEQKLEILEQPDLEERLSRLIGWTKGILADASLKEKIRSDVAEGMEKTQREFLLRQQMEAIKKQLNEGQTDVVSTYRERVAKAEMPENVLTEVNRELDRLERTSEQNPEYGWIRTYLDWMLDIPWNVRSEDNYDLTKARQILDEDHTGLGDVKDRIIEFLAVRKLRQQRGLVVPSGRGPGAIITLVGPPGVGKTSLGESVARALARKFTRVSLGGIRDEADIRGHRRTYVGALPGRIVRALKDAGTKNPVIMRPSRQAGLKPEEVTVDDAAIMKVISEHTREAGVRNLERELGKIPRKIATKVATDQMTPPVAITPDRVREFLGKAKFDNEVAARTAVPGVATGLAVTGIGGDVLFVEATATDSNGHGSTLTLTGQLGDVMKESAQIALSYVRSHVDELKVDHDSINKSFHIHVPEGAVPKDGPSAGVTMTTAIVSLLTGRPVRNTVGMTGEVTLQGLVLPIGGVKQKVLAAHRMGLTEVILPQRNEKDLDDVPQSVREAMTFHLASRVEEVLKYALEPASTSKSKTAAG